MATWERHAAELGGDGAYLSVMLYDVKHAMVVSNVATVALYASHVVISTRLRASNDRTRRRCSRLREAPLTRGAVVANGATTTGRLRPKPTLLSSAGDQPQTLGPRAPPLEAVNIRGEPASAVPLELLWKRCSLPRTKPYGTGQMTGRFHELANLGFTGDGPALGQAGQSSVAGSHHRMSGVTTPLPSLYAAPCTKVHLSCQAGGCCSGGVFRRVRSRRCVQ